MKPSPVIMFEKTGENGKVYGSIIHLKNQIPAQEHGGIIHA